MSEAEVKKALMQYDNWKERGDKIGQNVLTIIEEVFRDEGHVKNYPNVGAIEEVSAPTNSEANLELIRPFIGKAVIVKCADYQVQGVLVDCLPSFHRLYGSLILKDSSGIHSIRNWQIIGIKGENRNVVLGEIIDANNTFIVERNPINGRIYFLNVSAIQKISILNGKNNKEKE